MITKALIGCRIKDLDKDKNREGIIVGTTMNNHGRLFFIILCKDRTFTDMDLTDVKINEDDYKKVVRASIPEPIESRSEILDL